MRSLLLVFLTTFILGSNSQPLQQTVSLFPVLKNGRFGFINKTGKEIIQPQFLSAGNFSEGLAPARINGTYGYIDATGNFLIEPQFDYATSFSEGLAIVYKEGSPFFINHAGIKAFECNYESLEPFHDGSAMVKTNTGKSGMINQSGRLMIDTVFKTIHSFIEGLAVVEGDDSTASERGNRKANTGTFNSNGKHTIPNGSYTGIISSNGRFVVPYGIYNGISDFESGYFRIELLPDKEDTRGSTRRIGFVDKTGKLVMSKDQQNNCSIAGYPHCGLVKMNLYKYGLPEKTDVIRASGKSYSGYADLNGKIVIDDTTFSDVTDFSNNRAFVKIGRNNWNCYYRMINTQGKFISEKRFSNINNKGFNNGLAVVMSGDEWELIDTNANSVAQLHLVDMNSEVFVYEYFDLKDMRAKTNHGKPFLYGLAKTDGTIILKRTMQALDKEVFKNGLFPCMMDRRFTYVNENNKVVWQQDTALTKPLAALNIDFMNRGYFVAGSEPDTNSFGGYGRSGNAAHQISCQQNFPASTIGIVVQPGTTDTFQTVYKGQSVFLANTTNASVLLNAQDSRLYMQVQALNPLGVWKDIEYLPNSWCGNSYHHLILKPNQYWQFVTPQYEGDFKTKLRIVLHYTDPNDNRKQWPGKQLTIYSNEYDGSINPGQFWRKRDYAPTNLMDPYND